MKQMILMRTDLNMRKGKMVSQGAHASLKATIENLKDERVREWLLDSFTKITVAVKDESHLFELVNKARNLGIIIAVITDNGRTEFHDEATVTCAALGPDKEDLLDSITKDLKLL